MADKQKTQGGNNTIEVEESTGITGRAEEVIRYVNEGIENGDIEVPAKLEVENITALTDEQLNGLKCGDVVVKLTGNLKHAYKVTYKEEEQGICISYFACGYTETVAYDFVDGHWVYNSTDIKQIEDVVANPELVGTESPLESLQVGETKYKVEQPIDVQANPTLAGTESELQSIKVGNEKYKLFHPEQSDFVYLVGRIFSQIKVAFTADNTEYHIVAWTFSNEVNTFGAIDNAFDTFRDLGLTIPTIEDNETFTNALQIVYTANPQAFMALLIQLATPNYLTFKTQFWSSGSVNVFDLICAGDMALAYVEYQGTPATPTLVSFNATLDTIAQNAFTDIRGWVND